MKRLQDRCDGKLLLIYLFVKYFVLIYFFVDSDLITKLCLYVCSGCSTKLSEGEKRQRFFRDRLTT